MELSNRVNDIRVFILFYAIKEIFKMTFFSWQTCRFSI